jgi:Tol biopolymer transport system component/P pilus assembly chaperone PapD
MSADYTYSIKNSAGTEVKNGKFKLNTGNSVSIVTSGNYGVLTLSITDDKGTTADAATTTCVKQPKLTATGVCTADTAEATFVITNNGGDMAAAYTYSVKDSTGKVVKTGAFQLKAGASETVKVSGTYGVLTLSITDDKGTTTDAATTTCVKQPKLTATGVCTADTAEATFVITNNGGDMAAAYTYSVKDSTGKVVKTSTTFQLKAGASETVKVSGTYGVLTLSITDDKGTTADAATTTCIKQPKLTATGVCTADTAEATFVITNNGGDMAAAYTYSVKDSTGKVVNTPTTFQLKAGASETVKVSGTYGVLTLSITDDKGTTADAATTTCVKQPKLTATGVCTADTAEATFVITNNGGDMPAAYTYSVKDSTGKVVKTSTTFQLKAGASETVKVSGTYGVLTLSITDDKGTTTDAATTTCIKQPKLTATGVCTADTAEATFVITNNGGDMSAAYTYNVKDSAGKVVKTGAFQLKAGENTTVTTSGVDGVLTLSITDDKGTTTDAATTTCVKLPKLTAKCNCDVNNQEGQNTYDALASFFITNNGGDMTVPYTYVITDSAGNVIKTGTFQLKAGATLPTITTTGVYGALALSITDDKGVTAATATTTCVKQPKLTATGVCTADTAEATFVITNNGGDMSAAYTYSVKDSTGKVIKTPTTFQLKAGASETVKVSGTYGVLTLSITDDKGTTTDAATTICVKSSKLTATGVCTADTAEATFVITNNGGDMPAAYTYSIKDSTGKVVKASTTFQLKAGASETVKVSGTYGVLILSITDDKGTTTDAAMTTCVKSPNLTAIGACASNTKQATFTITNNGGDMPVAYTYSIKDNTGKVVKTDTFQLKAGVSLPIAIGSNFGVTLTLSITDGKGTTAQAAMTSCVEVKKETKSIPAIGAAKTEPCIQCLIFHTFRDENLEIYRLDGIEGQPGFKLYNLSKNEAVDSRPSRAPNDSEVVFQSNRDGNVELYTTDLLGSGQAARLTKTQSNNTTPMFGPDARTIVYQSDRNGNLDLFTIDKNTGKERQITSDPSDDTNPFYSPDLKWLTFQSNRNNNWDVFILNTETGNEYQLTSTPANETFPAWSPNGKQIAFISEENGNTDLYIIDTNGNNLKRITTDGKTVNAVWSPEGNRIAYQSERNGNLDVYSYDLKDNKEYRVSDYDGPDSGPTWDCGGTNLAFTSIRDGNPNVFQAFWKGGPAGNMTIDPATDKWSQWRPSNDVSSTGY